MANSKYLFCWLKFHSAHVKTFGGCSKTLITTNELGRIEKLDVIEKVEGPNPIVLVPKRSVLTRERKQSTKGRKTSHADH